MIAAFLIAALTPQQAAPVEGDQIVVRAVRRKCEVSVARRILSDREFNARAREWAVGRPLRVVVPAGSSYKCMAKIAFRLNDHGVTRFVFVDAPVDSE